MEFVDFNLAKKLKEKEFNVPCIYAYCEQGGWNKYTQKREPITYILRTDGNPFGTYYTGKNWNKEYETNKNKIQCSAPTISQVLKWLREKHLLVIPVPTYFNAEGVCVSWDCDIWADDNYECCRVDKKTYEKAALAGIEYVLNNLI